MATVYQNAQAPIPGTSVSPATAVSPGAMPALDRSRFVYDETLTSVGAAVAGDVVRRVSAGVWAPANADTAAHAAGPLGIYDGSAVNPIVGNTTKLNFVAAPTLMVPAYLSTTDGKATSTPPTPLGVSIFLGVPYVDTSVGAAYSGKVSNTIAVTPAGDIKSQLLATAVQDLGGSPADYDVFYDPFFTDSFLVGFDSSPPIVGWPATNTRIAYGQCYNNAAAARPVTPPNAVSSAVQLPGIDAALNYWQTLIRGPGAWAPNDRVLWAQRVAFSTSGTCFALVGGSAGFGIFTGGTCDANKFYFTRGPYTRFSGPTPTAGERIEVAARDNAYHWFAVEFLGDGTWRWSFDWGAWSAPVTDAAQVGGYYLVPMVAYPASVTMMCDDLFWAVKRT